MQLNSLASARILLLVLAVLLWLTATLLTQTTRDFEVPVTVTGLSQGLSIATPITTVTAKLSGRVRDVARISGDSLQARLDATTVRAAGNYQLPVSIVLNNPKVTLVSPSTTPLDIQVEVTTRKIVPVTPIPDRSVPVGYNLVELTASPSEVTVVGAPSLLSGISEAVAAIDAQGHRSSFTANSRLRIMVGGAALTNVTTEPDFVAVTATIEKGEYSRNLGIRPDFRGTLPTGYWVREVVIDPITAQVSGNRKTIDRLESLSTTAIELNDRTGDFTDEVSLVLPSGVTVAGKNLFKVTVRVSLLASYRQVTVTPEYVGLSEGFSVTSTTPGTVQAVISGDPGMLAALKTSEVHLTLDMTGKVSGLSKVELTSAMFSLPAGLQVVSFTPSSLDIIITRE